MKLLTSTVVLVLMVCTSSTPTSALTCYQCTECVDPFDIALYGTSTGSCISSCSKQTGTSYGLPVVVRGCGNGMTTGCDIDSDDGHSEGYCECTADLCNAASPTTSSLHITVLAAFLAAVYGLRRHAQQLLLLL